MSPTERPQRISSVDAIRGLALLGILLINIVTFALPYAAADDPSVVGGATGANLAVWTVNFVLFEGKMRALFSMLFGASIVIFTTRMEERGAGMKGADFYARRNVWLILFGMLHAYLFWPGDILFYYGVTALLLFAARGLAPKALMMLAVVCILILAGKNIAAAFETQEVHDKAEAALALENAGKPLTDRQKDNKKNWEEKLKEAKPPADELKKNIADHRRYLPLVGGRLASVVRLESLIYYRILFFDVAGAMLLGMALFKLGFFSAKRSYREYAVIAAAGYAIGIPTNIFGAERLIATSWSPLDRDWLLAIHDVERLAIALGHASVLMLLCKAGKMPWLTSRLSAVGQMALTNYLLHTIVCTTIFDRFNQYGSWQRYQIYYVVAVIWLFQLATSKIWLAHFQYGPAEWVWRSLTYWTRQPMRLRHPETIALKSAEPAVV